MERTARLVRLALAGLRGVPDPYLRGTADVAAAAVARQGGASGPEGAHAAGEAGLGSGRDIAHAVLGGGGASGREDAHAAGGAAGGSRRDLSHALLRARGGSGPEVTHAAGGARGGSGRELAHAVLRAGARSGREGVHAVVRKEKGANGGGQGERQPKGINESHSANQVVAEDHPHHRSIDDPKGDRVGSKAKDAVGSHAAGPGRGLSLAASRLTAGSDPHPAPYLSPAVSSSAVSCSSASERVRCTKPLNVHDEEFVLPKDVLLEDGSTQVDVSQIITSHLRRHPGPVDRFCIDSSKWTNSQCLDDWLQIISEKSVQELVLLNLGHNVETLLPIQNLESKYLRILRVGFLKLNLDLFCFDYSALQVLDLFCCTVESTKLAWIVTDCLTLKELKVQYCSVDLKINSRSLESVHSVGNTGNRIFIESAPNMSNLVSGIMPQQQCSLAKQKIRASLSINNVPSLRFVQRVILPYHNITVNNVVITKDTGFLPSVELLNLSLEMSSITQLLNLRKLLESFPGLQELCLVRMDNVASDEGFDILLAKPFEDINMLDSIKNSLRKFSLLDFRGGPAERHLIQSILKNAPNLMQLYTSRNESSSKRCIREALKEITSYDRVSKKCTLTDDV